MRLVCSILVGSVVGLAAGCGDSGGKPEEKTLPPNRIPEKAQNPGKKA